MNLTPFLFVLLIIAVAVAHVTRTHEAERLTERFLNAVQNADSETVAGLFCDNAVLLGTVSQVERRGKDIKKYFDYFCKLPNIRALTVNHKIADLEPDIYVNNAVIQWSWDGLEKPITARMSFVVNNGCIFELHSSALPKENEQLHKVSGKY
jgi:hypothetical protein